MLGLGVRRSVLAAVERGRKDVMVAAESGMAMVRGGLGCGEKEAGPAEEAVGRSMSGGRSEAEVESIVLFGVVGGGSIAVGIRTEDG